MKEVLESIDETEGKIVSKITSTWNTKCIHFTDNSCTVLTAKHGYNDSTVISYSIEDLDNHDLFHLEIITRGEFKERENILSDKREQIWYEEYQRLHQIYNKEEEDDK